MIQKDIEINCSKCNKLGIANRDETDPPHAVRMQLHCPECNDGNFDEPMYFDAKGKHIIAAPYECAKAL